MTTPGTRFSKDDAGSALPAPYNLGSAVLTRWIGATVIGAMSLLLWWALRAPPPPEDRVLSALCFAWGGADDEAWERVQTEARRHLQRHPRSAEVYLLMELAREARGQPNGLSAAERTWFRQQPQRDETLLSEVHPTRRSHWLRWEAEMRARRHDDPPCRP